MCHAFIISGRAFSFPRFAPHSLVRNGVHMKSIMKGNGPFSLPASRKQSSLRVLEALAMLAPPLAAFGFVGFALSIGAL